MLPISTNKQLVDNLVIGAGVVGLAVASKLLGSTVVADLHDKAGQSTSSRNSGVLHSGIYYPSNTRKSFHCQRGQRYMYEYAKQRGIPHRRTGKLIVACTKHEVDELERLAKHAAVVGIPKTDIEMITGKDAERIEPLVSAYAALHVKSTGIIDVASLTRSLEQDVQGNQGEFIYGHTLESIEYSPAARYTAKFIPTSLVARAVKLVLAKDHPCLELLNALAKRSTSLAASGGFKAFVDEINKIRMTKTENEIGNELDALKKAISTQRKTIVSDTFVNCGGTYADDVMSQLRLHQRFDSMYSPTEPNTSWTGMVPSNYLQYWCKGRYMELDHNAASQILEQEFQMNTLVYPCPEKNLKGLGVHSTLDMRGRVRFGPDAEYIMPYATQSVTSKQAGTHEHQIAAETLDDLYKSLVQELDLECSVPTTPRLANTQRYATLLKQLEDQYTQHAKGSSTESKFKSLLKKFSEPSKTRQQSLMYQHQRSLILNSAPVAPVFRSILASLHIPMFVEPREQLLGEHPEGYDLYAERAKFGHAISRYLPKLFGSVEGTSSNSGILLVPGSQGMRSKLAPLGGAFRDFEIIDEGEQEWTKVRPNIEKEIHTSKLSRKSKMTAQQEYEMPEPIIDRAVHLLGIESPGLTSSLSLAQEVRERLDGVM